MKTTLSFKIDYRLKDALLKLAEEEYRSLSNYVVTVLMKHLEEQDIDWRKIPENSNSTKNKFHK